MKSAVGLWRAGTRLVEGSGVVDTVLAEAPDCDLLVIGGSEEAMFRNLLMGNVAVQVAQRDRHGDHGQTPEQQAAFVSAPDRLEPSTKSIPSPCPRVAPLDGVSTIGNQEEHYESRV